MNEVLTPKIPHDLCETRKIISEISLNVQATIQSKMTGGKAPLYTVELFIIPKTENPHPVDVDVVGEMVTEIWTRERLINFSKILVDKKEGIVITRRAYQAFITSYVKMA